MTHQKQQEIWDKEHASPEVLPQMNSQDPSSGVVKFLEWLEGKGKDIKGLIGLEMGCGKGRNVIWLGQKGVRMVGFDFSPYAPEIAKELARKVEVENIVEFFVQDATVRWSFASNSFDFVFDCFATTDIESVKGRKFAASEMKRVVKRGGYILVYVMSTDDEYHREMIKKSPARERHAFVHPTGKFEKVFTREELLMLYDGLNLVVEERIPKTAIFSGREYKCNHHWIVFQKK